MYHISRVNARANFFAVRIISSRNKLSDDVVNSPNMSIFATKINSLDLSFAILGKFAFLYFVDLCFYPF